MDRFRHGQFLLKRGHQALELVGHLGEPVEAGVQQGRRCIAGHGLAALDGAVRVAGDAAVTINQIRQGLEGPVGGRDVGELVDAGDLLLGGRSSQQLLEEFHCFITR